MTGIHNLKPDRVVKAFVRAGWEIARQSGSHVHLINYPYKHTIYRVLLSDQNESDSARLISQSQEYLQTKQFSLYLHSTQSSCPSFPDFGFLKFPIAIKFLLIFSHFVSILMFSQFFALTIFHGGIPHHHSVMGHMVCSSKYLFENL